MQLDRALVINSSITIIEESEHIDLMYKVLSELIKRLITVFLRSH